jgi:hypothetical protein
MPLLRLAPGFEYPSVARQYLCLDNINLAATPLAPEPRAGTPADGQNLVGLDRDLYPLMCRVNLPLKPLPGARSRARVPATSPYDNPGAVA